MAADARGARASAAAGGSAESPPVRAFKSPASWVSFVVSAGGGVLADLWSKSHVFETMIAQGLRRTDVVPNVLSLWLSTNPGIVGGLRMPPLVTLAATVAAVIVVGLLFATSLRQSWGLHLGLGMVLAGAVGNAYDRLFSYVVLPGETAPRVCQVRDFIDVYWGDWHWPTFNVADMLLVIGVGIIMLHLLRQRSGPREKV